MTDELVPEPQALRIEHAIFGHHERVLQRSAQRISGAPQLGDVTHEAESPRPRDFAPERVGPYVESERLPADRRVVEIDLGLDPEAPCIRPKFPEGTLQRDADRLEHADEAARRIEGFEAHLIDRRHEGSRAAVHDRGLGTIDLDDRIVHAQAAQGRQHMLGGRNQGTRSIPQHGRKFSRGDRTDLGADLAVAPATEAGADEPDAVIGFGRVQGQGDRQAGMNPDAVEHGLVAKRGLPADLHDPIPPTRWHRYPETQDPSPARPPGSSSRN